MEALHLQGVHFNIWLQDVMDGYAEHITDITKVGDPERLMRYLFPLVCAVNRNLFMRFVITASLCDFMNNIFKWMLHGERPYWWVHEAGYTFEAQQLKQFSLTCESGPGSPSGHAMITASVWYILAHAYVSHAHIRNSSHTAFLWTAAWSGYVLLFVLVSTSRLYIAAHFPHQVLVGGLIGLLVGHGFTRVPIEQLRLRHTLLLLAALTGFGVCTYWGMLQLGVVPDWALAKALTHCRDPSWVHMSATPLSALFRDAGAILGLGLAVETHMFKASDKLLHRDGSEVATAAVSFIIVQILFFVFEGPSPVEHLYAFYLTLLVKNALISLCSVAAVPFIVMKIMNLKKFPTSREKPPSVVRRERNKGAISSVNCVCALLLLLAASVCALTGLLIYRLSATDPYAYELRAPPESVCAQRDLYFLSPGPAYMTRAETADETVVLVLLYGPPDRDRLLMHNAVEYVGPHQLVGSERVSCWLELLNTYATYSICWSYYLVCPPPSAGWQPHSIMVHLTPSIAPMNVPLVSALPREPEYTLCHCLATLHSKFSNWLQLAVFIEWHLFAGVEQFFVYRESTGDPMVVSLLLHYERRGLLQLVDWPPTLFPAVDGDTYFGQSLQINDCALRVRHRCRLLALTDADEMIGSLDTPIQQDWLRTQMRHAVQQQPDAAGFLLRSAFASAPLVVRPSRQFGRACAALVAHAQKQLQSFALWHAFDMSPLLGVGERSKLLVRPERIYKLGVHTVLQTYDELDWVVVPGERLLLLHQRDRLPDVEPNLLNWLQMRMDGLPPPTGRLSKQSRQRLLTGSVRRSLRHSLLQIIQRACQ